MTQTASPADSFAQSDHQSDPSRSAEPAGALGAQVYDLRGFLRQIGRPSFTTAGAEPPQRRDYHATVELLEDDPVRVSADPLDPVAFIDGIQNSFVLTHRDHRPILLSYTAAGAVGAGAKLIDVEDHLAVVCSTADRDWLAEVNTTTPPLPCWELAQTSPPLVEREAAQTLASKRAEAEIVLTARLVNRGVGPIVVDGSLLHRPTSANVLGVVKTTDTRYLKDETVLYGLRVGWRSPMFLIPAEQGTAPRYSCYLRLQDASRAGWSHGLIRLEAFTAEGLDPLAAMAMTERQTAGSGDHRWDRHLISVAACEKVLRTRRPLQFDFAR